jgi:hypothetical protein
MDYFMNQLVKDRQNQLIEEAERYRTSRRLREQAPAKARKRRGFGARVSAVWARLASHRPAALPPVADPARGGSVKV